MAAPPTTAEPVLHAGDHLDAETFLRRWEGMPELKRAELVEGRAYLMPSPVSEMHGQPHDVVMQWIAAYRRLTPGLAGLVDTTLVIDDETVLQPDYQLNLPQAAGGRTGRTAKGYVTGAPELVVEIAHSTESMDLHEKREIYRRAGVAEYLVWRTHEAAIDWWSNAGDAWRPIEPDGQGVRYSRVYPGLATSNEMLLAGDLGRLAEAIERACAGPCRDEHAALRERL